jgi:hypothetical protein
MASAILNLVEAPLVKHPKDRQLEVTPALFHTIFTIMEIQQGSGTFVKSIYLLSSHTALHDAEASAFTALDTLGYERSDFDSYQQRPPADLKNSADMNDWPYGDKVLIRARRMNGMREFQVGIATTAELSNIDFTQWPPERGTAACSYNYHAAMHCPPCQIS